MRVKNLKVGFEEIEDIAEHMLEQQKGGTKTRFEKYAIVKDLMKHKMIDAEKCIRISAKNHRFSKENLSKVVRMKTIVREEFMHLVDREVNRIWKEGKARIQNKAQFLAKKFIPAETEPEVHKGVIVGDKC